MKNQIIYQIGTMTIGYFVATMIFGAINQIPAVKRFHEKQAIITKAKMDEEDKAYSLAVKGKFAIMPFYNLNPLIRSYRTISTPVVGANLSGQWSLTEYLLVHNTQADCERIISYYFGDKKLSCEVIK